MQNTFLALIPLYICYIVFLGILMFIRRSEALKAGHVSKKYFLSYSEKSTQKLEIIKNHFENQFQVPVIFFVTCLAAIQLKKISIFTIVLGYSFFLSRLLHSYIHLGSNNLKLRGLSYFFGIIIILILWLHIFIS